MKKRGISLLLTLAMILACVSPAWAEDWSENWDGMETFPWEQIQDSFEQELPQDASGDEDMGWMDHEPEDWGEDFPDDGQQDDDFPDDEEPDDEPDDDELDDGDASDSDQPDEGGNDSEQEDETPKQEAPETEKEEPKQPSASNKNVITVTLGSSASQNYSRLSQALRKGSRQKKTVRIAQKGTYKVGKSGSSAILHLLPNTDLDLNGATLVRAGQMSNLFLVANQNDSYSGTGYNMCKNVTVRNGTLDGSGGSKTECNLVNIAHATNVVFSNVTFQNCRANHLLEFSGCRDCRVENCTFTGFRPGSNANEPGEAIQLDISYNGANTSWNGLYQADNTPCKNITITGCTFRDYPSGVGNHHAVKGLHNTGIVITNNVFRNTKTYKARNGQNVNYAAIHCYAFENSVVSGNVITGKYSCGIQISGGSVSVKNNRVGSKDSYFSTPALLASYSYGWIKGSSSKSARQREYIRSSSVVGNTIYCKSSSPAVTLEGSSKFTSVSSNTIVSSKSRAISVKDITISAMSGNVLTSQNGKALYTSSSKLPALSSNVIQNG